MQKLKSTVLILMLFMLLIINCDCTPDPAPYLERWQELNKDLTTFIVTMFKDWVVLKYEEDEQTKIMQMAENWWSLSQAQEEMKNYCGKAGFKLKFFTRTLFRDAQWIEKWGYAYEKLYTESGLEYYDGLVHILRIGISNVRERTVR